MPFSRRQILSMTGAGVAIPFLARRASSAEFSLKAATIYVADHPINLRLLEAVERIRHETGGRIDIELFPNNQLGGQLNVLSQLRSGVVDFFSISGGVVSSIVPEAIGYGVPFAFANYDEVWAAMDGDLGAKMRDAMKKVGIFAFDNIWDNGFRQTTTASKAISTPNDLTNFKIRVGPIPIWIATFAALGAAPTSIDWSETYTALRTRIADGQENPLALIDIAKLYEVQKYCSLTNHAWGGMWLLGNSKSFGALPKVDQELIARHFNRSALDERDDVKQMNTNLVHVLKGKGLTFNEVDRGPFQQKLRDSGFYVQWRKTFGEDFWRVLARYSSAV